MSASSFDEEERDAFPRSLLPSVTAPPSTCQTPAAPREGLRIILPTSITGSSNLLDATPSGGGGVATPVPAAQPLSCSPSITAVPALLGSTTAAASARRYSLEAYDSTSASAMERDASTVQHFKNQRGSMALLQADISGRARSRSALMHDSASGASRRSEQATTFLMESISLAHDHLDERKSDVTSAPGLPPPPPPAAATVEHQLPVFDAGAPEEMAADVAAEGVKEELDATASEEGDGMDEVLENASKIRGLRLTFLLYIIIFLVILIFVMLLVQVLDTSNRFLRNQGTRAIKNTAASMMNNAEMARFETWTLLMLLEEAAPMLQRRDLALQDSLCSRIYGAPQALGQYDGAGKLIWTTPCGEEALQLPPYIAELDGLRYSPSRLMEYSPDSLIAFRTRVPDGAQEVVSTVAVLEKNRMGMLMFSNSLPEYSSSELTKMYTSVILPDIESKGPEVAMVGLSSTNTNYSSERDGEERKFMQRQFNRLCGPSSSYEWSTLVLSSSATTEAPVAPDDDARLRPFSQRVLRYPIPKPSENYNGPVGLLSQLSLCGVLCTTEDRHATRCAVDDPTNIWFVVYYDVLSEEQLTPLLVISVMSIVIIVVFFIVMLLTYLSINVPVIYLRFVMMQIVGSDKKMSRIRRFLVEHTHLLWLGDLAALIRAVNILGLSYRLNKKYVPQHVLRHRAQRIRESKPLHLLQAIEEDQHAMWDESDDDEELTSHDVSGFVSRQPSVIAWPEPTQSMFLQRVAAPEAAEEVLGLPAVLNCSMHSDHGSRAEHLHNNMASLSLPVAGGTHTEMALQHSMSQRFAAFSPTALRKTAMIVRRPEESTILFVKLMDVESAFLLNYATAVKQHRRLMRLILQRIRRHKGAIFHRSGDCLGAAWNAFESCSAHVEHAAACAQDVALMLEPLRAEGMQVGVVLHQGTFICGTVEDSHEAFATAFGEGPRQACTIAELAATHASFSVVVTESVKQAIASRFECLVVDVIRFPQMPYPLLLFELGLFRRRCTEGSPNSSFAVKYATVFSHFQNHKFSEALNGITSLKQQDTGGGSAMRLLLRLETMCRYFSTHTAGLPLPYSRPYPTWVDYELMAHVGLGGNSSSVHAAATAAAPASEQSHGSPSPAFPALLPTTSGVQDEVVSFKQELLDNHRRMGSPSTRRRTPGAAGAERREQSAFASESNTPDHRPRTGTTGTSSTPSPLLVRSLPAAGTPAATAADPLGGRSATSAYHALVSSGDERAVTAGSLTPRLSTEGAPSISSAAAAAAVATTVSGSLGPGPLPDFRALAQSSAASSVNGCLPPGLRSLTMAGAAAEADTPELGIVEGNSNSGGSGGSDDLRVVHVDPVKLAVSTDDSGGGTAGGATPGVPETPQSPQGVPAARDEAQTALEAFDRMHSSIIETIGLTINDNRSFVNNFGGDDSAYPTEIEAKNGTTYMRGSRVLGRGSFGSVFLGMDVLTGKLVAIKFLPMPDDEEELAAIEAEVMIMQRVKDAHVVEFITYAFYDDTIVLVMECMMAGSLQNMIGAFTKIPSATARVFMRDVLRGLQKLHAFGVIHRDVKPQNVLLSLAGNCKISDFGASAWLQELARKEALGQVHGTPVYLAPEAARGMPVAASDLWSCGIMFLQLTEGRLPFSQEELALAAPLLVFQIGSGTITPTIPSGLDELDDAFVRACLQEDPTQRPTASQLLRMPLFAV